MRVAHISSVHGACVHSSPCILTSIVVEAKIDIPTGKGKGRKGGKKGDGDSSSSDSSDDEDKKKKKGGIAQFVKEVVKDVAEDIENLVLSLAKKAKADFANFGEPTDDGGTLNTKIQTMQTKTQHKK